MFDQNSAPPFTPGEYLARRRLAARLSLEDAAARLAALPWALCAPTPGQLTALVNRLCAAEADRAPFTMAQVALLRQAVPLDVHAYLALLDLAAAGPGCGLPVPQLCATCACSWHDPCRGADGTPCAWSETDPARCTACVPAPAAPRHRPPGPSPIGNPATSPNVSLTAGRR